MGELTRFFLNGSDVELSFDRCLQKTYSRWNKVRLLDRSISLYDGLRNF